MKPFSGTIALTKNSRGCYILDTVKGCRICSTNPGGCYGDCYAFKIARRYRFDFSNPVMRYFDVNFKQPLLFDFIDETHIIKIIKQIRKASMPFIRIGEMGDPSEHWLHTLLVCDEVKRAGKDIVIITKHWRTIPDRLTWAVCGFYINTSISALDSADHIERRLSEYRRLKKYCKSILRIVSCDFNTKTVEGRRRDTMQKRLFDNDSVIDTVFRPSENNALVKNGVIQVEKTKFLGTTMYASMRDKAAYLGTCDKCPDMCGLEVA